MSDTQILDIFYNQIVSEAQNGRIDCYFAMNIAFNLVINNETVSQCANLPCDGLLIPTLKITNKPLFDSMLVEYVKRASDFYHPTNFSFLNDLDITPQESGFKEKEEYQIKYIISSLLANASFIDFEYPLQFLASRIAMFDNKILNEEEVDFGYIESIGARLYIKEEESPIKSETPYRMKSYLEFDDGYKLIMPEIYAGNNGQKYQLYGIQKTSSANPEEEKPYLKQTRKGLIAKINGAPEHYFLAVMLFLSLCSNQEIEVIPFLPERWNAKRIANFNKATRNPNYTIESLEEEQNKIQTNITDIFIRYFTKLEDVTKGIDFYAVPFELDGSLHIKMQENFESRSMAFNELFRLANEYRNKRNNLGK